MIATTPSLAESWGSFSMARIAYMLARQTHNRLQPALKMHVCSGPKGLATQPARLELGKIAPEIPSAKQGSDLAAGCAGEQHQQG